MSKITIQCRLVATEATRQYLWHLMADIYTPFINEMLKRTREDENFEQWCQKGKIPASYLDNLCKELREETRFRGMPGRWYYAGRDLVKRIYKSWLAQRQRLRNQFEGQTRWLEILQSDDTLIEVAGLDLKALQAEANQILETLKAQGTKPIKQSKKTKKERGQRTSKQTKGKTLYQSLFDLYQETTNEVEKCAIAHLLKNKCQIPENPENPEEFQHRRRKAEIRLERINTQLTKSRLPKGRDLTNEQWLEALAIATEQLPKDEIEAANWQSRLLTNASLLPFPVAYETNEDLTWSMNDKGRLCASFNGLSEHTFEIYCDKRQLHWFKRFLEDQQIKKDSGGERSLALFTLRSGRLAWDMHSREGHPWNANRLTLSCSVDTRLWTSEGTEQVRQEKAVTIAKVITSTKAKDDLTQNQQTFIRNKERSLALLDNPFPRPSRPRHLSDPSIVAAVSFGLEKPATLAIVDITTGKAVTYRSIRQLLDDNYPLLNKQRLKQQRRAHERHKNQIQAADNTISEGGLGDHIDSLIAKAIVDVATEYRASSIVLPDLGNIREIIQTEVQAKAERKIPGLKEKQERYAVQFRASVHRWSYKRLAQKIATKAALKGIEIESVHQSNQGTFQEKARQLAISAYTERINHQPS